MEVSPYDSFALLHKNIQNDTNQVHCFKSLEEDMYKIHQFTQPFNLQFIKEVCKRSKKFILRHYHLCVLSTHWKLGYEFSNTPTLKSRTVGVVGGSDNGIFLLGVIQQLRGPNFT